MSGFSIYTLKIIIWKSWYHHLENCTPICYNFVILQKEDDSDDEIGEEIEIEEIEEEEEEIDEEELEEDEVEPKGKGKTE